MENFKEKIFNSIVPFLWISFIAQTAAYIFTDFISLLRPYITLLAIITLHYLTTNKMWFPSWLKLIKKKLEAQDEFLAILSELFHSMMGFCRNSIMLAVGTSNLIELHGFTFINHLESFSIYIVYGTYAVAACCKYKRGYFSRKPGKTNKLTAILRKVSLPWQGYKPELGRGTHRHLIHLFDDVFMNLWITWWLVSIKSIICLFGEDVVSKHHIMIITLLVVFTPRGLQLLCGIMSMLVVLVDKDVLSVAVKMFIGV